MCGMSWLPGIMYSRTSLNASSNPYKVLLTIEANIMRMFTLKFTGKRVGDHLEGIATPEEAPETVSEPEPSAWTWTEEPVVVAETAQDLPWLEIELEPAAPAAAPTRRTRTSAPGPKRRGEAGFRVSLIVHSPGDHIPEGMAVWAGTAALSAATI